MSATIAIPASTSTSASISASSSSSALLSTSHLSLTASSSTSSSSSLLSPAASSLASSSAASRLPQSATASQSTPQLSLSPPRRTSYHQQSTSSSQSPVSTTSSPSSEISPTSTPTYTSRRISAPTVIASSTSSNHSGFAPKSIASALSSSIFGDRASSYKVDKSASSAPYLRQLRRERLAQAQSGRAKSTYLPEPDFTAPSPSPSSHESHSVSNSAHTLTHYQTSALRRHSAQASSPSLHRLSHLHIPHFQHPAQHPQNHPSHQQRRKSQPHSPSRLYLGSPTAQPPPQSPVRQATYPSPLSRSESSLAQTAHTYSPTSSPSATESPSSSESGSTYSKSMSAPTIIVKKEPDSPRMASEDSPIEPSLLPPPPPLQHSSLPSPPNGDANTTHVDASASNGNGAVSPPSAFPMKKTAPTSSGSRYRPKPLNLIGSNKNVANGPATTGGSGAGARDEGGLLIPKLAIACLSPGLNSSDPTVQEYIKRSMEVRDQQRLLIESRQNNGPSNKSTGSSNATAACGSSSGGSAGNSGNGVHTIAPNDNNNIPPPPPPPPPPSSFAARTPGLSRRNKAALTIKAPSHEHFAHERVVHSAPLGQTFTGIHNSSYRPNSYYPPPPPPQHLSHHHSAHQRSSEYEPRLPSISDVVHKSGYPPPPASYGEDNDHHSNHHNYHSHHHANQPYPPPPPPPQTSSLFPGHRNGSVGGPMISPGLVPPPHAHTFPNEMHTSHSQPNLASHYSQQQQQHHQSPTSLQQQAPFGVSSGRYKNAEEAQLQLAGGRPELLPKIVHYSSHGPRSSDHPPSPHSPRSGNNHTMNGSLEGSARKRRSRIEYEEGAPPLEDGPHHTRRGAPAYPGFSNSAKPQGDATGRPLSPSPHHAAASASAAAQLPRAQSDMAPPPKSTFFEAPDSLLAQNRQEFLQLCGRMFDLLTSSVRESSVGDGPAGAGGNAAMTISHMTAAVASAARAGGSHGAGGRGSGAGSV